MALLHKCDPPGGSPQGCDSVIARSFEPNEIAALYQETALL
jgi:hypothetical protein